MPRFYLVLALFWLTFGTLLQVFWEDLAPRMRIPVDRQTMGFIVLFLFCYCLARWWLVRMQAPRKREEREPPPKDRVLDYDPNLDFSKLDDPKPSPEKKEPPAS